MRRLVLAAFLVAAAAASVLEEEASFSKASLLVLEEASASSAASLSDVAWWGAASQLPGGQKNAGKLGPLSELKRMGDLMRRQLQPMQEFSYAYDPDETPVPGTDPTMMPTPLPSPLPTPLPTVLPTGPSASPSAAPSAAPTISPAPTAVPTNTPTAFEVTQAIIISTSVTVSGLLEEDLVPPSVVEQVLAFALNDVVQEIEGPDAVLSADVDFNVTSGLPVRRKKNTKTATGRRPRDNLLHGPRGDLRRVRPRDERRLRLGHRRHLGRRRRLGIARRPDPLLGDLLRPRHHDGPHGN
mmetsp:Transcript_26100/g.84486  ORF Transcript_26100/g.84486 Transcript_26100/m.84486 type:complete len:298 (-) Transcript_26100:487-1380(-)